MKGISMATATAALMALGALAAAPAPADGYVLNFDTDAGGNPLAPGTTITDLNQPWESLGVKITNKAYRDDGSLANQPLMLFNSNCGNHFGVACTGEDDDLATGPDFNTPAQGNVLIISEDGNTDNPDDWAEDGGEFIFDFLQPVILNEVSIVDVDGVDDLGGEDYGYLTAFGANGAVLQTLDLRAGRDNGFEVYDFSNQVDVKKLLIRLPGSGAISGVEFTPQLQGNNDSVDIPEPASTLGLLALGACGLVSTLKRKRS